MSKWNIDSIFVQFHITHENAQIVNVKLLFSSSAVAK